MLVIAIHDPPLNTTQILSNTALLNAVNKLVPVPYSI